MVSMVASSNSWLTQEVDDDGGIDVCLKFLASEWKLNDIANAGS